MDRGQPQRRPARNRARRTLSILATLPYDLVGELYLRAAELGIDQDAALEQALREGWFAPPIIAGQLGERHP
jgi:hypothetical protein